MYSNANPKKPRIRVFSVVRKMNQGPPNQQQVMRVPKQEIGVPPARRLPPQQARQGQNRNGRGPSSSMVIEEVPSHEYLENLNNANAQRHFDEEKLPVFLVKLWNIVEDPMLQSIVHWDESGASFHIADPFSFSKNVLPHFFKHNNMNSLIRQLNMYGFRKMTPLSQGGLTRTESDQDHLEFSHPCFVQHRPELMQQIKRKVRENKQSTRNTDNEQNLEAVMSEMRSMREKAKNMEAKMGSLTKENREIWDQMTVMRQQHARQQQYFKKLLHFLVSVMQPGLSKRVAKRGVLEIDFGAANTPGTSKRGGGRNSDDSPYKDVCDLLESLQRETQEPAFRRFSNQDCGPLISEVTDEFGNSPGGRSDMFSDAYARYNNGDAHSTGSASREQSPHPIISQPSSSVNVMAKNKEDKYSEYQQPEPQNVYMGSGALTTDTVHRGQPTKRNYQGVPSGVPSSSFGGKQKFQPPVVPQKRAAPYKNNMRPSAPQPQQFPSNQYYSQNASPPQAQQNNQLMRIEDHHPEDTHQDLYSPTLNLSPSLDRQISNELQNYLQGYDSSLDNFRDLVHNSNWENFGDNLPEDDDEELGLLNPPPQNQNRLALKNAPESYGYEESVADLLDPLLSDSHNTGNGFEVGDGNYEPLGDDELFPRSPVLRTPSPSDLV